MPNIFVCFVCLVEVGEFLGTFIVGDEQEQVVVDSVVLTDDDNTDAEQVDNADDGSVSANDGDAEVQYDAEQSIDNENDVSMEQSAVVQSENPTVAAENVSAQQPMEMIQTSAAKEDIGMLTPPPSTVKAPILPATIDWTQQAPASAAARVRRRHQCFRCEESFFKESSLCNHLKSDHGLIMKSVKEVSKPAKEDNSTIMKLSKDINKLAKGKMKGKENECGRYVRNPQSNQRKRSSPSKSDANDDMDIVSISLEPAEKRKPPKLATEVPLIPLRRSLTHH